MAGGMWSRYYRGQRQTKKLKEEGYFKRYWKNLSLEKKEEIRKRARQYLFEMRELSKELGNCLACFKPKEEMTEHKLCINCRAKAARRYERRKLLKSDTTKTKGLNTRRD